jgi:hypothetical protein
MAKGRKTGGRQKGTPNRYTASVKEAFAQAFEDMGGADALVNWGRENPTDFYKLASKLIPLELGGSVEQVINLVQFKK